MAIPTQAELEATYKVYAFKALERIQRPAKWYERAGGYVLIKLANGVGAFRNWMKTP